MNDQIRIIVLADNTLAARNTSSEHGLAFWVQTTDSRVLFDTGQGLVIEENARALGVDLGEADAVVISHGHYDHTGGLAAVLKKAGGAEVCAHPDALLPKYKREGLTVRDIGIPAASLEAIKARNSALALSRAPVQVCSGIQTTGEIPRLHPEEEMNEKFCRDAAGLLPDPLNDDIAILIDSPKGTVVVLGCTHSGLINTLEHVARLTGEMSFQAVIGGMHLRSATRERMEWTLQELKRFKIGLLVPMHCTGQSAAVRLGERFPNVCRGGGTGSIFRF